MLRTISKNTQPQNYFFTSIILGTGVCFILRLTPYGLRPLKRDAIMNDAASLYFELVYTHPGLPGQVEFLVQGTYCLFRLFSLDDT
jgi:hypothetical protein